MSIKISLQVTPTSSSAAKRYDWLVFAALTHMGSLCGLRDPH